MWISDSRNTTTLTKFKDVNIKIDEIGIVKVTTSKYLGFIIDQTLRWGHHIDSTVKHISSNIGVPANTLTMLHSTIVLHHFDYVDCVYDRRTLTGSNIWTHWVNIFKDLSWMSLQHGRDMN